MKRCTKCNQVYADDLSFCLSDGTPLVGMLDDNEQKTVVRPSSAPVTEQPTVVSSRGPTVSMSPAGGGTAIKVGAMVIGLLLLLIVIGGAAAAYILWPRDVATVTNNTPANVNARSQPAPSPAQTAGGSTWNSAAGNRENELERERKRLADERKKLEDAKRTLDEEDTEDIPEEDDPPAPPPTFKDPGPSRIAFRRGSTGSTVSGTVGRARSYVLRAMDGQYLNASVRSPGGCVIFSSGGASTQFSTGPGDTSLNLKNTCSSPSTFSMSVTVR